MSYHDSSKMLVMHILDSGKGIERSNLDRLFKRFGGNLD